MFTASYGGDSGSENRNRSKLIKKKRKNLIEKTCFDLSFPTRSINESIIFCKSTANNYISLRSLSDCHRLLNSCCIYSGLGLYRRYRFELFFIVTYEILLMPAPVIFFYFFLLFSNSFFCSKLNLTVGHGHSHFGINYNIFHNQFS